MTEVAATDSRNVRDGDTSSPLPAPGLGTAAPPSNDTGRKSFPGGRPLSVAVGLLALIAVSRPVAAWHLPFPPCWLRKFTGIPCPSCGCTRSLLAWAHGDFVQAFLFNPLFCLLSAGVLLWPIVAGFERVSGRHWFSRAWERLPTRRVWQIAAVLVALNWLYLWRWLPK